MRKAVGLPKKMWNKVNNEPRSSHVLPRNLTIVTCHKCGAMRHNKLNYKGKRVTGKAILKGGNIKKAKIANTTKGGNMKTCAIDIKSSLHTPQPTHPYQE